MCPPPPEANRRATARRWRNIKALFSRSDGLKGGGIIPAGPFPLKKMMHIYEGSSAVGGPLAAVSSWRRGDVFLLAQFDLSDPPPPSETASPGTFDSFSV